MKTTKVVPTVALLAVGACTIPPVNIHATVVTSTVDEVTSRGVRIHLNGYAGALPLDQAEAMDAYLESGLKSLGYSKTETLQCFPHDVGLAVAPFADPGDSHWNECWGLTQADTGSVVGTSEGSTCGEEVPPPWVTPGGVNYVHEEAHWLRACLTGDVDADHRDSRLWSLVTAFRPSC